MQANLANVDIVDDNIAMAVLDESEETQGHAWLARARPTHYSDLLARHYLRIYALQDQVEVLAVPFRLRINASCMG